MSVYDDEEEPEAPAPIADPATGEIRVLEDRCTTCILNPAPTRAPLATGRLKNFTDAARANPDGHVVCHSTLTPAVPRGYPAAMCRGFADAYGLPAAAVEAIEAGFGHLVEVPDPTAAVKT
ncbi:hypothetical protein EF903_06870 [Streptomyces sp. WAC05292]|uniref:hypothetical protein n=1 Tax=Streptomyces sp. WAC05292 TaxID=2487418 RepID=UPI000F74ACC2|nr:hypothetical protein [Streptomyces sp. WAC05292]RSS94254.1 hypothetical protein EF903_06870 [Streptomyces sp. WAC05292]